MKKQCKYIFFKDTVIADPPYAQNTQGVWGPPKHQGGPLAPKDVLILVSFLSLARGYENINYHLF